MALVEFESRWMDEHIVLSKQNTMSLKGHIVDHNLNDTIWWSQKHIGYATREAVNLLNIKYGFLRMMMQFAQGIEIKQI